MLNPASTNASRRSNEVRSSTVHPNTLPPNTSGAISKPLAPSLRICTSYLLSHSAAQAEDALLLRACGTCPARGRFADPRHARADRLRRRPVVAPTRTELG